MRRLFLFGMVGIILFSTSCKKQGNTGITDPGPAPAFPYLRQGVVWTYINSDNDTNHAGITYETSYSIKSIDAQGYISVDYYQPTFIVPVTWYKDNNQWATPASKVPGYTFTLIKAHPVLNDTYSITQSTGITITFTRKVTSLDAPATVPAGSFTGCVLIHETSSLDSAYYEDYLIHPSYGIVRMEGTLKLFWPVILTQELKEKPF